MDYTERFITAESLRTELEPVSQAAERLQKRVAALVAKLESCGDATVGRAQIRKTQPARLLELLGDAEQVFFDLNDKVH